MPYAAGALGSGTSGSSGLVWGGGMDVSRSSLSFEFTSTNSKVLKERKKVIKRGKIM